MRATAELFRERGAAVDARPARRGAAVRADPDRLMQVMLNLLSNAAKFVPREGGRVEVRAAPRAATASSVEVRDNGPGVAPDRAGRRLREVPPGRRRR